MKKNYTYHMDYTDKWKENEGPLAFKMSNDYLFRALLQQDEDTLKAIISCFLGASPADIDDVVITNPIILGDNVDDKEMHLDVRTVVDHDREVDFEMQMFWHKGWVERSVQYTCRAFDNLNHGDDYEDANGVWQISFCNFDVFKGYNRLCSTYMLINIEDLKQIYTDKLRITNVNLKKISYATEAEIKSGIEKWARLFAAETWEELKMIAEYDKTMDYAISSAWQLTEDEKIREQMRRRAENERIWKNHEAEVEEAKREAKKAKTEAKKAKTEAEEAKAEAEEAKAEAEEAKAEFEEAKAKAKKAKAEAEEAKAEIEEMENELAEKDRIIEELKRKLNLEQQG